MRIGILSDTHDRLDRTTRAVEILSAEGAEALIHCGDLTGPDIVHECAALPCHYVLGNNDFDETALRAAIAATGGVCLNHGGEITLGNRRIAVTHGHSVSEMRRLLASNPHYLLYGHTHIPYAIRDGGVRKINPGALHRAAEKTVAVLDLGTDELRFLKVR